jgi:phage terminase large subunit GpA-like protein
MQPATIICENRFSDSARCGETALVRGVRYVYARTTGSDVESAQPVLREAHFQIECPRCGERQQVERFD